MSRKRQQCAALPYRQDGEETLVMLITSRDTGRWILPKGWAEKRLTDAELAAKEAFEEAGVIGEVSEAPIYRYGYAKRLPGEVLECAVDVFPLRVTKVLDDWPEIGQRRREWFTFGQAALQIDDSDLVALLLGLAVPGAISTLPRPKPAGSVGRRPALAC